jgi:hypothetical protein
MAGIASALGRVGSGVGSLFATITGGLYLIVLYVFTVWLVVGSLSAIQIRDDAQAINKEITYADSSGLITDITIFSLIFTAQRMIFSRNIKRLSIHVSSSLITRKVSPILILCNIISCWRTLT